MNELKDQNSHENSHSTGLDYSDANSIADNASVHSISSEDIAIDWQPDAHADDNASIDCLSIDSNNSPRNKPSFIKGKMRGNIEPTASESSEPSLKTDRNGQQSFVTNKQITNKTFELKESAAQNTEEKQLDDVVTKSGEAEDACSSVVQEQRKDPCKNSGGSIPAHGSMQVGKHLDHSQSVTLAETGGELTSEEQRKGPKQNVRLANTKLNAELQNTKPNMMYQDNNLQNSKNEEFLMPRPEACIVSDNLTYTGTMGEISSSTEYKDSNLDYQAVLNDIELIYEMEDGSKMLGGTLGELMANVDQVASPELNLQLVRDAESITNSNNVPNVTSVADMNGQTPSVKVQKSDMSSDNVKSNCEASENTDNLKDESAVVTSQSDDSEQLTKQFSSQNPESQSDINDKITEDEASSQRLVAENGMKDAQTNIENQTSHVNNKNEASHVTNTGSMMHIDDGESTKRLSERAVGSNVQNIIECNDSAVSNRHQGVTSNQELEKNVNKIGTNEGCQEKEVIKEQAFVMNECGESAVIDVEIGPLTEDDDGTASVTLEERVADDADSVTNAADHISVTDSVDDDPLLDEHVRNNVALTFGPFWLI